MLVTLAVILTAAAIGIPALFESVDGLRVEMAAQEMAGILHKARLYSARHHTKVAVKFRTGSDGVVTYALHKDGDGDGVRNADIDAAGDAYSVGSEAGYTEAESGGHNLDDALRAT